MIRITADDVPLPGDLYAARQRRLWQDGQPEHRGEHMRALAVTLRQLQGKAVETDGAGSGLN